MNFAILGSFDKVPFAPGWTKERALALLGGGDLDLSTAAPASEARLTAAAVLGNIVILVPAGAQVSMSGASVLGSRELDVLPGD